MGIYGRYKKILSIFYWAIDSILHFIELIRIVSRSDCWCQLIYTNFVNGCFQIYGLVLIQTCFLELNYKKQFACPSFLTFAIGLISCKTDPELVELIEITKPKRIIAG